MPSKLLRPNRNYSFCLLPPPPENLGFNDVTSDFFRTHFKEAHVPKVQRVVDLEIADRGFNPALQSDAVAGLPSEVREINILRTVS